MDEKPNFLALGDRNEMGSKGSILITTQHPPTTTTRWTASHRMKKRIPNYCITKIAIKRKCYLNIRARKNARYKYIHIPCFILIFFAAQLLAELWYSFAVFLLVVACLLWAMVFYLYQMLLLEVAFAIRYGWGGGLLAESGRKL